MRAHRRRQYGRRVAPVSTNINSLAPPFQPRQLIPWGSMPRNLYKQRAFSQSPVPPGYRLTKKHQKVPTDHQSYKPMQDALNESMLREIRNTEPGKRRDYLIAKWEAWVANGMPTWGSPGKNADKNEWHKTQAKGSGVWQDEVEDQHPRQKRRYNLADLYPEYAEG